MESFWTAVDDNKLRQGDYLLDCPVPVIQYRPNDAGPHLFPIKEYNLIIMTQSCDLENAKVNLVATCPIYTVANYEKVNEVLAKKGRWEEVRKGRIESLYLLSSPENPDKNQEALVVDFREIYSLPFELLTKQAESQTHHWRLKSPYLEHFSQAFARFFMRVGLPSAIPPFK